MYMVIMSEDVCFLPANYVNMAVASRFKYIVRTNGPTLCPFVWLPFAPESFEESFQQMRERIEAIQKGTVLDHWSTDI